jgi:hypothetical protein
MSRHPVGMKWPAAMPFPIFFKIWEKTMAHKRGWDLEAKRRGFSGLTWEAMKALAKDKPPIIEEWAQRVGDGRARVKAGKDLEEEGDTSLHVMIETLFFREECRTFMLSSNLIESLKNTNLRPIPSALVRVPFPLTYLDFSSNPLDRTQHEASLGVRGIFVVGQDTDIHIRECRAGGVDPKQAFLGIYVEGMTPIDTGKHISFSWHPGLLHWRSADGMYQPPSPGNPDREIFALWVNSLLYINSVNADISNEWYNNEAAKRLTKKKGRRRRDLLRSLESEGRVDRVGYNIEIPKFSEPGGGTGQGGKVNVRFTVRGHWHTYWVGEGRTQQDLKWIAPYWKGPETADVVHRTYDVDEREGEPDGD